jgi:hypothetical protein
VRLVAVDTHGYRLAHRKPAEDAEALAGVADISYEE